MNKMTMTFGAECMFYMFYSKRSFSASSAFGLIHTLQILYARRPMQTRPAQGAISSANDGSATIFTALSENNQEDDTPKVEVDYSYAIYGAKDHGVIHFPI